ncbi:MAG: M20/M25/M40 family metallo-hydrolase [Nannocystaceae bacterium]
MSAPSTRLTQALCEAVDASFEAEQVIWLRRLVNRPSHTPAADDVEAAARVVDELAAAIGLRKELVPDPGGNFADHRIYHGPGVAADDRAMALVGHVDTVFPKRLGFLKLERDASDSRSGGDIVRGPGTLDMKSGLSSILFALRAVQRVVPQVLDVLKVRFVCNTDEEVGSPSSRALFERLAAYTSVALIFEGGRDEDRVITSRKGGGSFRFTVTGKPAHAGIDHREGVNAIHALALLIPRIEAITDYARGVTVNVGIIEGGTAKNTVPEEAWCQVDARFVTQEGADHVVACLEAVAERAFDDLDAVSDRLRQATCVLTGRVTRPPMEAEPRNQALRRLYEPHAARLGLGIGEAPLQGGGSDANLLSAFGVPCIDGLGPFGKGFHSPSEWSSLESLRRRTCALACFLATDGADGSAGAVGGSP